MKKWLTVAICLILMISIVITGCSSNGSQGTNAEQSNNGANNKASAGEEQAPKDKVKLSIIAEDWGIPAGVDMNKNRWADLISEGNPTVDIQWEAIPQNQFSQKQQLLMSSGEAPNVVRPKASELVNWASKDYILPVDEYIEKYIPNLKRYLDEKDMEAVTYNGKIYGILAPVSSIQNPVGMYIRKDWLDNLGLSVPTNTEQLMEVMKAFTFDDPDQNGEDDTYGFTSSKNLGYTEGITFAYDVTLSTGVGYWSEVDGQLIPDMIRPEAKDALAYLRDMYAADVYDKESLVINASNVEENLTSGKYGIGHFSSWGMWSRINNNVKDADPNAEFVSLPPIEGPNGAKGWLRGENFKYIYALTKGTTPEQAIEFAKLINWWLTPDESKDYMFNKGDVMMGEMGKLIERVGDNYYNEIPNSELTGEAAEQRWRHSYRLVYSAMHLLPDKERMAFMNLSPVSKWYGLDAKYQSEFGQRNDMKISGAVYAEYMPNLVTYWDELKMKIVTGSEPLDAFDAWVDYFYKNNGDKVIEEVNQMN